MTNVPTEISSSVGVADSDRVQDLQEEDLRGLSNEDDDNDDDGQSVISISTSVISEIFNTALGNADTEHPTADDRYDEIDRAPPGVFNDDMYDDYDIDEDGFDDYGEDEGEDGGDMDFELYDDEDGIDDYDVYEGDFRDEYGEEDDYEDIDDDDYDDDGDEAMYPDRRSADTEFGGVEMIYPRRMFRGAKNVETVKDCMSLLLPTVEEVETDKQAIS